MTIFIVNDNSDELYLLSDLVYDIASDDEIIEFDNPLSALAAAREADLVILMLFAPFGLLSLTNEMTENLELQVLCVSGIFL